MSVLLEGICCDNMGYKEDIALHGTKERLHSFLDTCVLIK